MVTQPDHTFAIQRAGERACFDHGWLRTCHSFSFAEYVDPANANWGALRVFNDDTVAPGKGFGTHPHRDMEIVTYVLRGELEHRGSLGHHGVVSPGGIQYVSAGRGVSHSEFNHSPVNDAHFVQMWALPRTPGGPSAYGQHDFAVAARRNRWLAAAAGLAGVDAPVVLRVDAALYVAQLADASVRYIFDAERLGFLFVAEGSVTANGERLSAGDGVRLRGIDRLDVEGNGELVLWDVPPADTGRPT